MGLTVALQTFLRRVFLISIDTTLTGVIRYHGAVIDVQNPQSVILSWIKGHSVKISLYKIARSTQNDHKVFIPVYFRQQTRLNMLLQLNMLLRFDSLYFFTLSLLYL